MRTMIPESTTASASRLRSRAKPSSPVHLLVLILASAGVAACEAGPGGGVALDPSAIPEIRLSVEPLFTIGVVGGDPDYELFEVRGAVRMFGSSGPAQPSMAFARHDGTLMVQPAFPIWLGRQSRPDEGIHRAEHPIFELGPDGAVAKTIGPFLGQEWFVTETGGNGRMGGPRFMVSAGRESVVVGSGVEF